MATRNDYINGEEGVRAWIAMPVLVENFHRDEGFRKVITAGVPSSPSLLLSSQELSDTNIYEP